MNTILLFVALSCGQCQNGQCPRGQHQVNQNQFQFNIPGQLPQFNSEKERLEWFYEQRKQEAYQASLARKARIAQDKASGAIYARWYPGTLGGPNPAQLQVLQQMQFMNQMNYSQKFYLNNYNNYRPYGYNNYGRY